MKTEVYSWRLSAERKCELEAEARSEGTTVSDLLDRVTGEWLAQHRNGRVDDKAEQNGIRNRAMAAIGSIRGGFPTRSARTSELIREIVGRKHVKESRGFIRTRRTAGRTD